jgi:hypothetical protein
MYSNNNLGAVPIDMPKQPCAFDKSDSCEDGYFRVKFGYYNRKNIDSIFEIT